MTARHELPDRPGRAGARKPDLSLALLVFGSAMLAAVVVGFWSGAGDHFRWDLVDEAFHTVEVAGASTTDTRASGG
jgi:hypothetical protein